MIAAGKVGIFLYNYNLFCNSYHHYYLVSNTLLLEPYFISNNFLIVLVCYSYNIHMWLAVTTLLEYLDLNAYIE